jgi:diguanylate cyclase (GGDEF)-like protein
MKILIVDDNPIDIALIKRELNSMIEHQYDIYEAKSVSEGLEIIDGNHFDVLLLDYHMPECDGIEMLIELRTRPNLGDTAIIVVSAAKDISIALRCIEAGAQDFLAKNELTQVKLLQAIIHSRKRFELEQKMFESYLAAKEMAEKDPLTGVFSRYNFEEKLQFMMMNAQRSNQSLGLLLLDLDNFKHINDSLGHDVGDELLKALVERVHTCLRANDCFARFGGDEFSIILGNITAVNQINTIAQRILDSFKTPFSLLGNPVTASISIGAVNYPSDAEEGSQLLKCADIALYRAKQQGKNTICFFESKYQNEFNRRFTIQSQMTDLIYKQAFCLVYQPIFDSLQKKMIGAEALLRWPDTPNKFTPDEFIPIAEESRLINELGKWVIDTAMAQLKEFQLLIKDFALSINVSPIQLNDSELCQYLLKACHKHLITPQSVTLEITETALVERNGNARKVIQNLHDHGFIIALDDFGMGFSSISHLTHYPIGLVKLDKSLLSGGVDGFHKKKVIFEAVVLMLKRLNLTIVAEGIEQALQLEFCQAQNIERLQGYHLGRPMPVEKLMKIISRNAIISSF